MARRTRGFTVVELLIVMVLIVVLASIGMADYRNSLQHAREAALKQDLVHMREAIDQFSTDKARYPNDLDELVTQGYIREVPQDPMTRRRDTWQTIPAANDVKGPAQAGIVNVKSGSGRTALNGTRYSEWD